MGVLDSLLTGPHAQGAFLLRLAMAAPWSLSVEDEAPLTIMTVLEGQPWVIAYDVAVRLGPGDVCVAKGPDRERVPDQERRPDRGSMDRKKTVPWRTRDRFPG